MLECISHALCAVLAEQTLYTEMDLPYFRFSFNSYHAHPNAEESPHLETGQHAFCCDL